MISIGVLTPHAAPGPEAELPDMAPGKLNIRVARITAYGDSFDASAQPPTSAAGLAASTAPAALDEAAAALPAEAVDVIVHASTTTGYAIGCDAETAMVERLSQRWQRPVVGTSLSAVAALRALGMERVALVHPPWFEPELHGLGSAYFGSRGFDVVQSGPADLPNDPARIEPDAVVEWASRHVSDEADAVFLGGNGFRAAAAIAGLEQRIGRPVLESNQVLLWSIVATLGTSVTVNGYGRLFGEDAA